MSQGAAAQYRSRTVSGTGFERFDQRGYPTVGVRRGYGEWAPTYEQTVVDEMDVALLAQLRTVSWRAATDVADLGCGTGRTGAWLRERGAVAVDGVDVTPEMLAMAHRRGLYRTLLAADVVASGLESHAYDVVTCSLVDEHLEDARPLYAEAARLLRAGGAFVHVGYHPHFIMASGMPTHFDGSDGPVAIETHIHQLSEHVASGLDERLELVELRERIIDDAWVALKPKWDRLRGHPVSFAFVWRAPPRRQGTRRPS
jgi:SAM-dependent methyltransferase